MSLRGRSYSILIVSAAGSLTSAFADLLPEVRYSPSGRYQASAPPDGRLRQRRMTLLSSIPLCPTTWASVLPSICAAARQSVVLLLVKATCITGSMNRSPNTACSPCQSPYSKATMTYALSWLESARERLRQFEKKSLSIEEKMAEIRLVNKAKWLLISQLSMSEPEAHRYIEKQAMDRCVTRQTIAGEIIKTYS